MELHQLRYFSAVARHRSFSRAAESCFVSQPSLSQQIRKLEGELGEPLIKRCREGALLTPFGRSMLPRARRILAEVEALEADATLRHAETQGTITLGAIPTVAPYLLPQLVAHCRAAQPGMNFVIEEETTDVLIRHLHAGRVEFAVLSPPFPSEGDFLSETLMEDELLLTVTRDHVLARKQRLQLRDVSDFPIVLLKEVHCLSRQSISLCETSGSPPQVTIESSQLDTALALVELGFGFTFTPAMARSSLEHRKVVYRSLHPRPVSREIVLIWPRQQPLSRVQKSFVELARTYRPDALQTRSAKSDGG